ncbi:hypothetical protein [uncultured Muribaculum sp.]|uniref:hypothetical protein n=1 Tax=uncultured Muribaculum sp. TaxID=1918613 RepID=UPI0032202AD6
MDLIEANKTKLYNQGAFWAFNTAKYRALLSNDPTVIKYWYKHEAGKFFPDVYKITELQRSFYYGDEFVENAEEFFGIIPMICESIAKLVCGSGYDFADNVPPEIKNRLQPILDENEFDTEVLKSSMIETLGLGDAAWHVYFDNEISSLPIIELVPPERLALKKKGNRVIEYTVKQQVVLNDEPQPYELHTVYTRRKKKVEVNGATRYVDDGILQRHRIFDGSRFQDNNTELKKQIFTAYGVQEQAVLPLVDFPIVYLPNNLNNAQGATRCTGARPYGVVFGLDSVSGAIDEILSNCVDTVRKSFPYLLIDEQMIPSDITGDKDKSAFSTRRHSFLLPKNAKEAEKLLQQIQAKLNTTEFVDSVKFQINIALNKVGINAATLGLQLSGHIESEATQNAKERNSIRTRNTFAADYQRHLEKLFAVLLQYEDYINGNTIATDESTGETAVVADEYHGIKATFRKYIVDTPEEVSKVLAEKVRANLMSIFAAVREQHPEWDDEAIYKETNLIYAEKAGAAMQIVDPTKPPEESVVISPEEKGEGNPAEGAGKGLQDTDDPDDGEQADDKQKGEKSPK